MFACLTRFLAPAGRAPEAVQFPSGTGDARLAACALLLELAHADGEVCPAERIHMGRSVREQFGLGPAEAEQLLGRAARLRGHTVRLVQLTSHVLAKYSRVQIAVLAEIMSSLVRVDGHVAPEEVYSLRKICFLLRCEPSEASESGALWARRRV